MNRFASILMGAVSSVAAQSHAAAVRPPPISTSATHVWAVKKGSPDFDRIRAFLLSRVSAADSYSVSNLDSGNLGDFILRVSIHRPNGLKSRDETATLLIPLGGGYGAGDTWSVSTRTPKVDQAWTWTYSGGPDGGAWKLTRYTYRLVRLPNGPAAG